MSYGLDGTLPLCFCIALEQPWCQAGWSQTDAMQESELTEVLRSALVRLKKEPDEVKLLFTEGVNSIVDLNSTRHEILPNSASVPEALTQDLHIFIYF